jgi:hypothetical protein
MEKEARLGRSCFMASNLRHEVAFNATGGSFADVPADVSRLRLGGLDSGELRAEISGDGGSRWDTAGKKHNDPVEPLGVPLSCNSLILEAWCSPVGSANYFKALIKVNE